MQPTNLGSRGLWVIGLAALTLAASSAARAQEGGGTDGGTYTNPLPVVSAEVGQVESCPDPEVLEGDDGDPHWYLYCTTGPLRADEVTDSGGLGWHQIPMFRSLDLVNWEYVGDAFDNDPATATAPLPPPLEPKSGSDLWAPEPQRIGDRFYLFFAVTNTTEEAGGRPGCNGDSSIGYAVGEGPLGPWQAAEMPLIAPRLLGEDCDGYWTIDPEVFEDADGRLHIFYGGASGGIEGRELLVAEDGSLTAPVSTATAITVGNRWSFEGAEVVQFEGLYYLFASATNCCNGPQTGYTVLVGRSPSPTGPFIDRQGASMLGPAVGGTPVLAQNGNRWIGPGHNVVVRDRAGQWWTLYHAVDEDDPYFAGFVGFTKRPLLLDALGWVDGWPVVNGGAGPSDSPQPAPALYQDQEIGSERALVLADEPGALLPLFSDEFEGPALSDRWTWLRPPAAGGASLAGGILRIEMRADDLPDEEDPPLQLLQGAPEGDFLIETRVRFEVPDEGCCLHGQKAGLVVQSDESNDVKLVLIRVHETWHTEFAREMGPVPEEYPRYGNSVIGPPGDEWTWLRIAVRRLADEERYTASTSRDGTTWVRGSTWTHALGDHARIGLVAMGEEGSAAEFDHVRVSELGR